MGDPDCRVITQLEYMVAQASRETGVSAPTLHIKSVVSTLFASLSILFSVSGCVAAGDRRAMLSAHRLLASHPASWHSTEGISGAKVATDIL